MSFRRWLFPSGYRAANHYNRGTLACHSGDWISAEAHLREAVRVWQDYPDAWHNLGIALAGQGRFEDAIQAYETALMQRRNFAEAWNNFGSALANAGRIDDAREAITESLRLKPSYQKARENLELLNEIVERHSDTRDRKEPDPPGDRQVSLDSVAASTVDDPVTTVIDGAPEPDTPVVGQSDSKHACGEGMNWSKMSLWLKVLVVIVVLLALQMAIFIIVEVERAATGS